jgi:prevent-host-death family protein
MTIERIGVAEAKRRFSELADRVGRGESFVIMSRGRPVVALVPPQRATEEEYQPSLGLPLSLEHWPTSGTRSMKT